MFQLSPDSLQNLLSSPIAEVIAVLMNQQERALVDSAVYNLVVATGNREMMAFVTDTMSPYIESNITDILPVVSDGGRRDTASVLRESLLDIEDQLGVNFDEERKASAMMYAILFLTAVAYLRDSSLPPGLGISKSGFFRPRWKT